MKLFEITLFLIVLACTKSTFARKDFAPGYIVNMEGDTILGLVQDRNPGLFVEIYEKIRFVQEGKRKVKKYSASDIAAYGCGGVDFRSVRLRNESVLLKTFYYSDNNSPSVFLKVISSNEDLVLYAQEFAYDDSEFVDSFPLFHISGSNQMVRATQGFLGLKKKRLVEYFSKCKTLVDAIEKETVTTSAEVFDLYMKECTRD
ncbi:MAG: hypothetical protein AB8B56_13630 [Crocinitomicaceae bacterium]